MLFRYLKIFNHQMLTIVISGSIFSKFTPTFMHWPYLPSLSHWFKQFLALTIKCILFFNWTKMLWKVGYCTIPNPFFSPCKDAFDSLLSHYYISTIFVYWWNRHIRNCTVMRRGNWFCWLNFPMFRNYQPKMYKQISNWMIQNVNKLKHSVFSFC